MKLIDVVALTPPGVQPVPWAHILSRAQPESGDVTYITTPAQRSSWLRRLQHEDRWTDVSVTTSRPGFLFWRLTPQEFPVYDESGKKLTKAQRTADPLDWAAAQLAGTTKKPELRRWLKLPPNHQAAVELVSAFEQQQPADDVLFTPDGTYELVGAPGFLAISKKILGHISFGGSWSWDCETDQAGEEDQDSPNPNSARLVGVSISIRPRQGWYFPVGHLEEGGTPHPLNLPLQDVASLLRRCFHLVARNRAAHQQTVTLGHNVKYDYSVMANSVQDLIPIQTVYDEWLTGCEDTMLLAAICNLPARLKVLAPRLLGVQVVDYKKLTGGRSFAYVPPEKAVVYAAQDSDWPLRLFPILWAIAGELRVQHIYRKELSIIEYFMRMERRGFAVNVPKLQALHDQAQSERARAYTALVAALRDAGAAVPDTFNPGSSQQMSRAFFAPAPGGLGLPVLTRTDTGAPSASAVALNRLKAEGIHHPALVWYRFWSKLDQLITAFTTPLLSGHIKLDGRVHPNYHQVGAQTGRTSASDPNAQQLPAEVRTCIEPEEGGELASLDYSQIELRVLAVEFNEPKMIATFQLPRFLPNGEENPAADIHATTQREVGLPSRRLAKNFNFGKSFGAGKDTLSVTAGIPVAEAEAFSQRFDAAYPDLTANIAARHEAAEAEGLVRNWAGRVRLLTPASDQRGTAQNRRLVANTPVQGGALDIIKWAMQELLPLLREFEPHGIHAWNMVHDELDFEREARTPDDIWRNFLRQVQAIMQACNPFSDVLPIYADLEVGPTWGDLRAVDAELTEAAA